MLGVVFGLGAALLSLPPYVSLLEEKIGLGLLFTLRGRLPPPAEVAVVNIDRESANILSPVDTPEQWPHRLHAELIRRLHAAGAELIGFNIFFSAPQPQDDPELAAAMREAGSVVLADYLRLKHLQGDAYVESLEEPEGVVARAALATAPFLLAENEEADRLLTRHGETGDHPTLPVVMLRLFAMRRLAGELDGLLRDGGLAALDAPGLAPAGQAAFFAGLEGWLERQPASKARLLLQARASALPPGQKAPLLSLIETLADDTPRYFNHYGPVGTIPRIPCRRLLAPRQGEAPPDLRGKVVLVGFDEDFQAGNLFFSPFSAVGSLELAATAVANLLAHEDIQPLFGRFGQPAWLFLWGNLIGLLTLRGLRAGILGIAALSFGYLATAYWLFSAHALWLPMLLPLFWLTPLGVFGCLLNNYLTRERENRQIHSVIDRFIPDEAARREDTGDDGHWQSKLSFGVCLATDAGQYTTLAETMRPMDLGELMNDYYAALFPAVRRHGGWVSDVTGDAMMAVWSAPRPDADLRAGALRAALDILRAVDDFEAKRQVRLPVRMGLHCGEMRVGFVGGKEHGAYRAVGDTVNTSSRLEGLNKLLGTRVLVSEALVAGLPGFITRPVGQFLLAGKTRPVAVHELIAPVEDSTRELASLIVRFADALALFQAAQWQEAADAFEALERKFPEDGPARFYSKTAKANAANPGATAELAAIAVSKPPPGALAGR